MGELPDEVWKFGGAVRAEVFAMVGVWWSALIQICSFAMNQNFMVASMPVMQWVRKSECGCAVLIMIQKL